MQNEKLPTLIFQAPLFTQSGYGHRSLDLCKSLMRLNKYDIKIVPTKWGSTPQVNLDYLASKDEEVRTMLTKILTTALTEQPEVFVQVSIPNEFITPAKYNIGVTAGIETTLPRGEWIEGINRMNLTLVSSEFSKDVFLKAKYKRKDSNTGIESELKVEKPIEVLFEGIDVSTFFKQEPMFFDEVDQLPEDFLYLFCGHWLQGDIGHDRKDVGGLIRTFSETFADVEHPPALLLKCSCGNNSYMDQQEVLKRIVVSREGLKGKLPNVYLLHGELTDSEMNDLYNHKKVKAHITFTHGEGYGRPLVEASLSGKPIIASNWSGHLDFLPKEKSILLEGAVKPVHQSSVNDWIIQESGWFFVNYEKAKVVIKDVFFNYIKYYDKCKDLAVDNASKFSHDAMTRKLKELFDKNIPEFPKKVGLVLPKLKKIGELKK